MINQIKRVWWFYPTVVLAATLVVSVIIGLLYSWDVMYEVINFGLIIAIITYLFSEYVIPFARGEIAVERAEKAQLERQESSLSSQVQSLSHDSMRLMQYNMRLEKKMASWVCAAEKELAQAQRQADSIERELQKRAIAQMEHRTSMEIQYHTLCEATASVRHSLQKKYANTLVGRDYLAQICETIERGSA